jgi:hypothetical protein
MFGTLHSTWKTTNLDELTNRTRLSIHSPRVQTASSTSVGKDHETCPKRRGADEDATPSERQNLVSLLLLGTSRCRQQTEHICELTSRTHKLRGHRHAFCRRMPRPFQPGSPSKGDIRHARDKTSTNCPDTDGSNDCTQGAPLTHPLHHLPSRKRCARCGYADVSRHGALSATH